MALVVRLDEPVDGRVESVVTSAGRITISSFGSVVVETVVEAGEVVVTSAGRSGLVGAVVGTRPVVLDVDEVGAVDVVLVVDVVDVVLVVDVVDVVLVVDVVDVVLVVETFTLTKVHRTLSPSDKSMTTFGPVTVYPPPRSTTMSHSTSSRTQPWRSSSVTTYSWKSMMSSNTLVSDEVPSSTREKSASGDGDAVKSNPSDVSMSASFTMVIRPGYTTAVLLNDRSIWPVLQLETSLQRSSVSRM